MARLGKKIAKLSPKGRSYRGGYRAYSRADITPLYAGARHPPSALILALGLGALGGAFGNKAGVNRAWQKTPYLQIAKSKGFPFSYGLAASPCFLRDHPDAETFRAIRYGLHWENLDYKGAQKKGYFNRPSPETFEEIIKSCGQEEDLAWLFANAW